MIVRTLLFGSALLAASAAGAHSITVIGANADAIACFRAADSERERPGAVATCTAALAARDLSSHDRLATFVNRGIVRFRLRDFDGAIADFDEAMRIEPNQPDALVNKGITMLAAGAPVETAAALIEEGLQRGPQRPWVGYYGRGVAHELAGRDAQAYRDYRRAIELRPGWAPAERALARFTVLGG